MAACPAPPPCLRAAPTRADRSAIDSSRAVAMSAKWRTSPATRAGSALAARRSGRSKAEVVAGGAGGGAVAGRGWVGATAGDSATRPGSCRKPPGPLYVENGRGSGSVVLVSRQGDGEARSRVGRLVGDRSAVGLDQQ